MNRLLEIATFLSMNGKAIEAIEFYKKNLYAEELFCINYQQMAKRTDSIKLTEKNKDYISHSVLKIGNSKIMIAEDTMDVKEKYCIGNNISICIQSNDLSEIKAMYNNCISDKNTKIISELNKNEFSEAYGILEDPFGIQIQFMYDTRL